jgi:hypothetical protein
VNCSTLSTALAVAGVPYDEAAIVDLRWRATTCWEDGEFANCERFCVYAEAKLIAQRREFEASHAAE